VHTGFCWGDLWERDNSGDLGIDGRVILNCFLQNWNGACTRLVWLRIGTGGGRGSEPSGFVKCE
jgi:hypothetical protein